MKKPLMGKLAFTLSALIFVVATGWMIAKQGPLASIEVNIETVRDSHLERTLFGIGTVEAKRTHNIGPTSSGRVAHVWVDHGEMVKSGQILAKMEPVELDARLSAGASAVAAAVQRVRAAEATLAELVSRDRLASDNANRYADLRKQNFISQEAMASKLHEAAATRSAHQAAVATLAVAKEELGRTQSELEATKRSLAHLQLKSPVDGVVVARMAEPGSTVVAGQSIIQVIDPLTLWLRVRIDQGLSNGLKSGLTAEVTLRSRPTENLSGHVARIDWIADSVTEERIAYVLINDMPSDIVIGELAEVTLNLPTVEDVLAIPAAAIQKPNNQSGVWQAVDGRVSFTPVSVGVTSADGWVEIRQGLVAGDRVIVHSSRTLHQDARIKPMGAMN